jgi:hypothetical protein
MTQSGGGGFSNAFSQVVGCYLLETDRRFNA